MEKVKLLTEKQIEKLEVLKEYGTSSKVTDLYIMQNGYVNDENGEYWTQIPNRNFNNGVFKVTYRGEINYYGASNKSGIRPLIKLSTIKGQYKKISDDIIEYGEYPQNAVDKTLEEKLEILYQQEKLNKTSKEYTFIQRNNNKKYQEYLYGKNKYIRANETKILDIKTEFKNGRKAENNENYWIKVEPIRWLVDEKEDIAISKYILSNMSFSFDNHNNYENSDIKKFLKKYFIKDIIPSKNINISKIDKLINIMEELNNKEEKPIQKVR